jgi:hypothetical protein
LDLLGSETFKASVADPTYGDFKVNFMYLVSGFLFKLDESLLA